MSINLQLKLSVEPNISCMAICISERRESLHYTLVVGPGGGVNVHGYDNNKLTQNTVKIIYSETEGPRSYFRNKWFFYINPILG